MPTYDYQCRACGHKFEAFQSMKEASLVDCPNCGKPELVRLISAGSGLLFKGSGFYITDYRKAGYNKDASKDSGSSALPDPPKPSKPSKPESKSDS